MNNDYRWPKISDNAFDVTSIDVASPTLAAVKYLEGLHADDSWLADAFKGAADKIIHKLKSETGQEPPDMYFMPIGYLYRHALELKLKRIIHLALKLKLLEENKNISETLRKHRLYPLWNYAKESFMKFWPGAPVDELAAVERFVQSFHSMDNSGQNLRYTVSNCGQSTLAKMPEYVDLAHLEKVFAGVFNQLTSCEAVFGHAIEIESEAAHGHDGE